MSYARKRLIFCGASVSFASSHTPRKLNVYANPKNFMSSEPRIGTVWPTP